MNRLESFYQTTMRLHGLLKKVINEDERQDCLAKINILVEKRAHLMSQVSPPFTKEEKKIVQELMIINKDIQKHLNKIIGSHSNKNHKRHAYHTHSRYTSNRQEMFVYR